MSVELCGSVIRLAGAGRIEDAEPLVMLLQAAPARSVDLTQAGPLHAAVVQVLLAYQPPIMGPAGDPFAQSWLMPLLNAGAAKPAVVADAPGMANPSATE